MLRKALIVLAAAAQSACLRLGWRRPVVEWAVTEEWVATGLAVVSAAAASVAHRRVRIGRWPRLRLC